MENLLRERNAAKFLGFSYSWLKALRQKKGIRFVRIGRAVRYRKSDLIAFVESRVEKGN